MIRKLTELHLDKVADSANKGQLISVKIYKADSGKNKGSHMIDYEIDKGNESNVPTHQESHRQLIKTIREIRECVSTGKYNNINLNYDIASKQIVFRIVADKV